MSARHPTRYVSIVLRRQAVTNPAAARWQSYRHVPVAALMSGPSGESAQSEPTHIDGGDTCDTRFDSFAVTLFPDEAEGYYLNVSSPEPCVFFSWRMAEDDKPYPFQATLSYNEAGRWMDGGEQVDRVAMPPELFVWAGEWVEHNYQPEVKKKRIRPNSFKSKDGRYVDRIDESRE